MNIFLKLKTKTKLIIFIIFMVIGINIVGFNGGYNMNKLSDQLEIMYDEHLVPIHLLADVENQTLAIQSNLFELLVTTESSHKERIKEDISVRENAVNEDITNYGQSLLAEYESEQYALLKESITAVQDFTHKFIKAIESGEPDEAYALFQTGGNKELESLKSIIDEITNHNITNAHEANIQNDATADKISMINIIITFIMTFISLIFGILITTSISKPLSKVVKVLNKTAEFDLTYDSSLENMLQYKNEIGIMVRALTDMRSSLGNLVKGVSSISRNLATHSEELSASTDENTKVIVQVVDSINKIADGNSSQAEMISGTNQTISDVVRTISNINQSTLDNAESAAKSLYMVELGEKAVNLTIERMHENFDITQEVGNSVSELAEMVSKVESIISVITSIADQTGLLSFNAAIEAARAGEAGAGFSVVSEEIRKLAEGTSEAAKEITAIIKDTTEKSKKASKNMASTKLTLDTQIEAANNTKDVFDKIKLSVADIVNKSKQMAHMLNKVDLKSKEIVEKTDKMAAVAEGSAAASQEISTSGEEQLASVEMIAHSANDLSKMAEELNNEVRKFKL
ncbi:methyl-accepting chemotaxis protein [Petroclostridium sp. X23]|uniref:methyl-accepting chemotaxis protein n=1 Tax=Petroclostridium sp. X23 TaxID=3045146 RepID=UPI0024AD66B8|nr:methyl-accepting chemotaxis protein [Petroclostridium sp. X23]WHH59331.1 methyl-accepting chemotaxis protein [Petroclostridium sp. X23]